MMRWTLAVGVSTYGYPNSSSDIGIALSLCTLASDNMKEIVKLVGWKTNV